MANCSAAPWSCTEPIATSPGPSFVILHVLGMLVVPTGATKLCRPLWNRSGGMFGTAGSSTLIFKVPPALGGVRVALGEVGAGDSWPGIGEPWSIVGIGEPSPVGGPV